ncbi:hypothetical protein BJ546DRAFT_413231 [Cryomyces antarcticus]
MRYVPGRVSSGVMLCLRLLGHNSRVSSKAIQDHSKKTELCRIRSATNVRVRQVRMRQRGVIRLYLTMCTQLRNLSPQQTKITDPCPQSTKQQAAAKLGVAWPARNASQAACRRDRQGISILPSTPSSNYLLRTLGLCCHCAARDVVSSFKGQVCKHRRPADVSSSYDVEVSTICSTQARAYSSVLPFQLQAFIYASQAYSDGLS